MCKQTGKIDSMSSNDLCLPSKVYHSGKLCLVDNTLMNEAKPRINIDNTTSMINVSYIINPEMLI